MGAEEGRADRHRPLAAQLAGGTQRLLLIFEIEPVAGLYFDRGYALGDQRIEARQRLRDQLILAGGTQRLDRGDDAATRFCDVFIGGAG